MVEMSNHSQRCGAESTGVPVDEERVLIVDDEEGIRGLFSTIISQDLPDVQLDQASNGAEALELFRCGHHQVLIMDLHMPVMDGLTAFGAIKQFCDAARVQMPAVIFCTGFAPPATVRDIIKGSPLHHFLSKPVKGEVLVRAIRTRLH